MAEPLYRQVARDIEAQIQNGQLQPGQQVPTELELRERYEASRNTIRDAIRWLVALGLVETRAGQGCFVTRQLEPFVTRLLAPDRTLRGEEASSPRCSMPRVEVRAAASNLAAMLRLRAEARVVSRTQERYVDDVPWSLQTSFYPMELVTRGAECLSWPEEIHQGVLAYLEETIALKQVGYRDRLVIGPPNETETRFFRLPEDGRVPVVTIFRTGYTDSRQGPVPFRLTVTVFPGDRNQFIIDSGENPDFLDDPVNPRDRVLTL